MALSLDTTIGGTGSIIREIADNTTPITTASFSTAANVRLVVLGASNGVTAGTGVLNVSGAGLSWSKEVENPATITSTTAGTAIWVAYSVAALSSVTVSMARTGTPFSGSSFVVVGILGAESTHGGAEATSSSASGTPSCAVTSTRDGSYIFSTMSDFAAAGDTAVSGSSPAQTLLNTHHVAGEYSGGQGRSTSTVSIGSQTMGYTVGARDYKMAVIEIREDAAAAPAQNLPAYDPVPFIPRGRSM